MINYTKIVNELINKQKREVAVTKTSIPSLRAKYFFDKYIIDGNLLSLYNNIFDKIQMKRIKELMDIKTNLNNYIFTDSNGDFYFNIEKFSEFPNPIDALGSTIEKLTCMSKGSPNKIKNSIRDSYIDMNTYIGWEDHFWDLILYFANEIANEKNKIYDKENNFYLELDFSNSKQVNDKMEDLDKEITKIHNELKEKNNELKTANQTSSNNKKQIAKLTAEVVAIRADFTNIAKELTAKDIVNAKSKLRNIIGWLGKNGSKVVSEIVGSVATYSLEKFM